MYLLVFTTLIIAMIGIYAQVLAVEVGRLAASQMTMAQTMIAWHTAAVSMAASIIDTNTYQYNTTNYPSGCSLSSTVPPGIPVTVNAGYCPSPSHPACMAGNCITPTPVNSGALDVADCPANTTAACTASTGTVTNDAGGLCMIYNNQDSHIECVHLPSTYVGSTYQFYSFLYKDAGGSDYVVTYLPAATLANNPMGFLALANGNQLSLTNGNMMQQLGNTGIARYTYGGVQGSTLVTSQFSFTLPISINGAVAIISSPDGF